MCTFTSLFVWKKKPLQQLCGFYFIWIKFTHISSVLGFSFSEVGCICTRNKVTYCHFSSDGQLLASAGHDKKAVLWNMDLQTEATLEEHNYFITDVKFRPNSNQLAAASFDKSMRLWDETNPSYCLNAYTGHTSHVISLDFHPKKSDLFCLCDSNNEILYWSISPFFLYSGVQARRQRTSEVSVND